MNNNTDYTIWFIEDAGFDGHYRSRLGDIEVALALESGSLTCTKIKSEDVFLCEVGQCPHNGDPDVSNCYETCPYKFQQEGYEWVHVVGATHPDTLLDSALEFRKIVRDQTDGFGRHKKWPRMVKFFAEYDWIVAGRCMSADGRLYKLAVENDKF